MIFDKLQEYKQSLIQPLVKQELDNVEARFAELVKLRSQVKSAVSDSEKIEDLIAKIDNFYRHLRQAENYSSSLTRKGYYGAQMHDQPEPVLTLRKLNSVFNELKLAINKILGHLKDEGETLEQFREKLEKTKDILKRGSGFRRYSFLLRFLNPKNYLKKYRAWLNPNRIAEDYEWNIFRLNELVDEETITEKDIHVLERSLHIVYSIHGLINRERDTWLGEKKQGNPMLFGGLYPGILENLNRLLPILAKILEDLAEDEQFIAVTNVKIIKLERKEVKNIKLLAEIVEKLFPLSE